MREKLRKETKKISETYNRWTTAKWFKGLSITTSVFWNLAILLAIILVAGGVFAASVGAGYFASLVDEEKLRTPEEMRNEIYSYEETSEIFFDNGVYLGKLRTDLEREETNLDKVSPVAVDAVLATEDEYFKEHDGIVPKAIFRGLFQDVSNSDSQTGGSTLTQQLIKNQILTNEVSYERKAKEILLAMRLEKFMTKDEIMEAYLNIIPYGRNSSGANIAGIETAANGLFNIPASDLNLPQAAYIAGIPKAPFRYTPYTSNGDLKEDADIQHGIDRMKTVLYRMKETEYITEQQYNEAIAYDIKKDFRTGEKRSYELYPDITVELEKRASRIIMDILAEENGIEPIQLEENDKLFEEYAILADRAVRSNGYRIFSSINKEMFDAQKLAAQTYESYGTTRSKEIINAEGEKVTKDFPVQVGSMTIENATGRILSFVSGRDQEIEQLNHATQAFRSIGSTVKPLLVYGPAIEYGKIGAGSPVVDVKYTAVYGGTPYSPSNFISTSEQGIMPARNALAESQNLPASRLFIQIQNQKPSQFLIKAGLSRAAEDPVKIDSRPASALGGGVEASVEELTIAYSSLSRNGKFLDGKMIDRIEDAEGNIVFERATEEGEQVFTSQTAYILTDMLRDVFKTERGTAKRANGLLKFNSDIAGKSGTTQDAKDVWLVGYNPNITMSVWLGYGLEEFQLNQFPNRDLQPSTRVNEVWARIMNATYDANPELVGTQETFQAPKGVVSRSFCAISGFAPGGSCVGGLLSSDLFNANVMVPSKADDSLTSGFYTTVNGSRYAALDSTPREFVISGGSGVSKAFVDRMLAPVGGDASKLFPGSSRFSNVVSSSKLNYAAGAPGGVQASLNGNTLSWSNSASNDVVGYRVFRSGGGNTLLASIPESRGNSYTVPGAGSYFVVAVDITGLQSPLSNTVSIAAAAPPPPPPEEPVEATPPPEEEEETVTPPPEEEEPEETTPPADEPVEPEEPTEPEDDGE